MRNLNIYVPKAIIVLLALAIVLNIGRIFLFESYYFIYILWNIFLAILPFIVSSILLSYANNSKLSNPLMVVGGILWLLLIPNAPYIITDLIHIHERPGMPLLYDSFMLFSSALVGLILGMYSISHIDKIIRMKFKKFASNIFIAVIILLISFGVYLGRFLRFNSWDVFHSPLSFIKDILNIFSQPSSLAHASIHTFLFFLFIYMSYVAWKSFNIKI